jgi:hypothetical protein
MIGGKSALSLYVNDMKGRYVHRNIERGETPVGAASVPVRSEEKRALAAPKPLSLFMGGVKFQAVQKS